MSDLKSAIDAVLSYQWHGPREQLAALERLVTEARRVAQPAEPVSGVVWGLYGEDGACLIQRGTEDERIAKYGGHRLYKAAPPAPQPERVPLTDELPQSTIDCWAINYALHMTPHSLHDHWRDGAPPGAVLALKAAVEVIERLRAHGIKSEDSDGR